MTVAVLIFWAHFHILSSIGNQQMVHLEHDRKRSGADEASNHKLSAFNLHHAAHTAHENHQVHKTVDEAYEAQYDHDDQTYKAHETYKVVQIYSVHRMGLAGLELTGGLHC
ncbi:hypothetical protein [Paenibacillus massiliensis]|uniref:hypothetical protein n=1 Tax=Paenibacillus massiliensis TaxID=225917 RepID=UPI0018CC78A3|nr:hypothetical protein [Paenibacillus massiliensis]